MYQKINVKLARKTFDYNPTTGEIFWKTGRFAGLVAGTKTKRGYIVIEWKSRKYYAHRLAVSLHTGKDISNYVVDHKDYNCSNNVFTNLQLCKQRVNLLRRRRSGRQSLKYRGILRRLYSYGWRYLGAVVVNGKRIYSAPQKTQKEAYRKYLQLFARYNGIDSMCPKMLSDYVSR